MRNKDLVDIPANTKSLHSASKEEGLNNTLLTLTPTLTAELRPIFDTEKNSANKKRKAPTITTNIDVRGGEMKLKRNKVISVQVP